jgi:hypothetical protein
MEHLSCVGPIRKDGEEVYWKNPEQEDRERLQQQQQQQWQQEWTLR